VEGGGWVGGVEDDRVWEGGGQCGGLQSRGGRPVWTSQAWRLAANRGGVQLVRCGGDQRAGSRNGGGDSLGQRARPSSERRRCCQRAGECGGGGRRATAGGRGGRWCVWAQGEMKQKAWLGAGGHARG
jgi:hypothetical protein